nr:hypothetical protein [uncultured Draconibacterium sp.]
MSENKRSIMLRLDEEEAKLIERIIKKTGEKAATKAILRSCEGFIDYEKRYWKEVKKNQKLEVELDESKTMLTLIRNTFQLVTNFDEKLKKKVVERSNFMTNYYGLRRD